MGTCEQTPARCGGGWNRTEGYADNLREVAPTLSVWRFPALWPIRGAQSPAGMDHDPH